MNLNWLASASASAFHAAAAIAQGRTLIESPLAEALASPTASLIAELTAAGIGVEAFFGHAVPLAAAFENNRELAGRVLSKLGRGDHELLAGRLAGWFSQLESAFRNAVPGVVDELELRSGPLREQWEARGPGLLAAIGRRTEPGLLAESAEVIFVFPALGGDAEAHLAYNKITIEAVLTNRQADLPEVARLGWLLATLNLDLPKYAEPIPRERLCRLAKIAMLPAALAGAADVELMPAGAGSLAAAIGAWRLVAADGLAETLEGWWQTYQEARPAWSVALAALDRLLYASTIRLASQSQAS